MEGLLELAIMVPVLAEGPRKRWSLRSCLGRVSEAGVMGECGNQSD